MGVDCLGCDSKIRPAPQDIRSNIIHQFYDELKTKMKAAIKDPKVDKKKIVIPFPGYEVENMQTYYPCKEREYNMCLLCQKKVCYKCKTEEYTGKDQVCTQPI